MAVASIAPYLPYLFSRAAPFKPLDSLGMGVAWLNQSPGRRRPPPLAEDSAHMRCKDWGWASRLSISNARCLLKVGSPRRQDHPVRAVGKLLGVLAVVTRLCSVPVLGLESLEGREKRGVSSTPRLGAIG